MTMRLQTPRSSRTNTSSRRVKPWLSCPTGDIMVIPFASWDVVGSIGNNIIGPMIARALVHVRLTPGILGQLFLYVGPVPAIESGRLLSQRLETFFRRWIPSNIESKGVQRGTEKLDLGPSRLEFCFLLLPNKLRQHQPREQSNNNHDNDQLDEREAGGCGGVSSSEFRVPIPDLSPGPKPETRNPRRFSFRTVSHRY